MGDKTQQRLGRSCPGRPFLCGKAVEPGGWEGQMDVKTGLEREMDVKIK